MRRRWNVTRRTAVRAVQVGLAGADKLDGGPGLDTARFDRRLDAPAAVKNLLP